MERCEGKMRDLEQQASDPRRSQPHRPSPRLRLDRRGCWRGEAGEAQAMPFPWASAALLALHSQKHEAHPTRGFHDRGNGQDLPS